MISTSSTFSRKSGRKWCPDFSISIITNSQCSVGLPTSESGASSKIRLSDGNSSVGGHPLRSWRLLKAQGCQQQERRQDSWRYLDAKLAKCPHHHRWVAASLTFTVLMNHRDDLGGSSAGGKSTTDASKANWQKVSKKGQAPSPRCGSVMTVYKNKAILFGKMISLLMNAYVMR